MAKAYNDLDNTYAGEDDPLLNDPAYGRASVPVPGVGGNIGYMDMRSGDSAPLSVGVGSQPNSGQDVASPWSVGPSDGDWGSWFLRNIQSLPARPESLDQIEPLLKAQGITLVRNAAGKAGKIKLPNGQVKDVGVAFSSGDPSQMKWQFADASDSASASPDDDWFSQNAPAPEAFQPPARPDYLQGEYVPQQWSETYKPLSADELYQTPGYQAREAAIERGLNRSAAAKGSILSGGFIGRTMPRALSEFAGQEYGSAEGRNYQTYADRMNQFNMGQATQLAARGLNESTYENDVSNAASVYDKRYRTWRDSVDDQFRLSQLGLGATTAGAPA